MGIGVLATLQLKNMNYLYIDFETRSAADLKKCGADVYARDPSTDILCMAWAVDGGPVQLWTPDGGPLPMFGDFEIVAHNMAFELAIWNFVGVRKYSWPPLKPERCLDTMAQSYAMALPGALVDAAPAAGLHVQKDSAGHRVMLKLSQPRTRTDDGGVTWWEKEEFPEQFEKLYAYCKQDIEVERALHKRLLPLSEAEQKLWILDRKINDRGVQVDLAAARVAVQIVDAERARLDLEMREVTKNAVATCTATQQLKEWLESQGVSLDGVAKADVLDLLNDASLPADCRRALLLRQEAAKSSTAKLESMIGGVCDDGRIRGLFQYHGAGATGRWAGRRIQPQNFPRPSLKNGEVEEVFALFGGVK